MFFIKSPKLFGKKRSMTVYKHNGWFPHLASKTENIV